MLYSLLTTVAVVMSFSLGLLAGVPDLREKGLMLPMTAMFFGLLAWALFMLPVLLWQKRRSKVLHAAPFCELGMLFGSLFPLFFFVSGGPDWFLVWRGGQCVGLSLLAIPAGGIIGWIQGHKQAPAHGRYGDPNSASENGLSPENSN